MFIPLTEEQEKKIMQDTGTLEAIQKYAETLIAELPEYVEPKVMTYEEKLRTPCTCHICEADRVVKLAAFEKTLKVVK